jgi:hypothetical protein
MQLTNSHGSLVHVVDYRGSRRTKLEVSDDTVSRRGSR